MANRQHHTDSPASLKRRLAFPASDRFWQDAAARRAGAGGSHGRDAHMPSGWTNFGRRAVYGRLSRPGGRRRRRDAARFSSAATGTLFSPAKPFDPAQLSHNQTSLDSRPHARHPTVVNLRGSSPDIDWYLTPRAGRPATSTSPRKTSPFRHAAPSRRTSSGGWSTFSTTRNIPLLLHCRQGVDRTGLAAALHAFIATPTRPRWRPARQLSLRYGHVAIGPTRCMLQFFDLYDDWLRRADRPHSPTALREWADHGYCPGRHAAGWN